MASRSYQKIKQKSVINNLYVTHCFDGGLFHPRNGSCHIIHVPIVCQATGCQLMQSMASCINKRTNALRV